MNANQNQRQNPKAVLITGAHDRLGLEIAKECLDLGYNVIIHHRTSAEPAASLFNGDNRVAFIHAELTESAQKLMGDAATLPLTLEGLINNAAVFQPGDISDVGGFECALAVNTLAPLRLSAEFARLVKSGWIINVTDARAAHRSKKYQNYRISKLFLDEITRQSAYLYAPAIRVNAIAPGAVLPSSDEEQTVLEGLSSGIPLNKTGGIGDIRKAVKFLIESGYVTGAVVPVDGGWGL
ncbi:MAG: SDR family oxidoreductase [Chitinispirillales bacterium]|jgi:NAD(P)-dependent dehydrogenase (short-subunit alcohol dehydrogenase family)|nr:SDR family oxidoreductase [Chitinispirillales bacterium]